MSARLVSIVSAALLFFCSSLCMNAQNSVSDQQIEKIAAATSSFKSIVCDITQTRVLQMMDAPVVSKGKMNYLAPGKLRLEYTTPDKVAYVINGSAITTIAGGKSTTADLSANRKATGMFDFIMTCITGECITDRSSFNVSGTASGNDIVVTLVPIKRDLKQMFQSLEITFDSSTSAAKKIIMNEKGGNSTTLVFTNVRTGAAVDASLFE